MRISKFAGFINVLLFLLVVARTSIAEELTAENYARWRDYILPKGDDLGYLKIPWRMSYWDAVVEAQDKDKPILLWAMNGHPLCNT